MKALLLNKKIKIVISLLLAFTTAFYFCACNKQSDDNETRPAEHTTQEVTPESTLTVPYTPLDSLNPFFCTSVLNSSLVSLVFRSLYCLDAGFTAINDLAQTQDISSLSVKVTIDDGHIFSDGSPLSSADIVYSFLLAKNSPLYEQSLSGIESCETDGNYAAVFKLSSPDINVLNVLTFPVAKRGTADTQDSLPIGSGFYVFNEGELQTTLGCNLKCEKPLPKISTVRLRDIRDSASVMHLLDTGDIDCFFSDLSDGTSKRTYSSVNEIYLNNLVFLGFNQASYRISMTDFRRAIKYSVDKKFITENAFLNHARVAEYPFNSSWHAISGSDYAAKAPTGSRLIEADVLLNTMSCGTDGEKVTLRFICPDSSSFIRNTAQYVADNLKLLNIEATLSFLDVQSYNAALFNGEYDIYLGEIKLTKNMDLSPFFTVGGKASYGIELQNTNIDDVYFSYKRGETELDDFLTAFDENCPFVPIAFRNGQFCYSRSISGGVESTEESLFKNIDCWKK